jgi:hypothetical protein
MFFRRYKSAVSNVILMVMIFASLAPAVSHALVSFTGNQSFSQRICTTGGSTIVIKVKTTLGKQLATELPLKNFPKQSAESHFEHCPFCANPQTAYALPSLNALIIETLEAEAQNIAEHAKPLVAFQPFLTPPSQAPPHISNS